MHAHFSARLASFVAQLISFLEFCYFWACPLQGGAKKTPLAVAQRFENCASSLQGSHRWVWPTGYRASKHQPWRRASNALFIAILAFVGLSAKRFDLGMSQISVHHHRGPDLRGGEAENHHPAPWLEKGIRGKHHIVCGSGQLMNRIARKHKKTYYMESILPWLPILSMYSRQALQNPWCWPWIVDVNSCDLLAKCSVMNVTVL